MGDPVGGLPQASAPKKKVWEQDWFKWCGVVGTVWGSLTVLWTVLTAFYGGAAKVLKSLPIGQFGGPRWFGVLLYYFMLPISILGLYLGLFALILSGTKDFMGMAKSKKFSSLAAVPLFVIALIYISRSETPGYLLFSPFLIGVGFLFLVGVGIISAATGWDM